MKSQALWNLFWVGLKPAAQFLVGAVLLGFDATLSGEYYSALLVWTVGFALCAPIIERHIVSLAHRQNAPVGVACRALFWRILLLGGAAAPLAAIAISWATSMSVLQALALLAPGVVSGTSEAILWAIHAENGDYKKLAATRGISVVAFTLLVACLAIYGNTILILAALGVESLIVAGATVRELSKVKAQPFATEFKRLFGFWTLKIVSYVNQQTEAWLILGALSAPLLATYRVGSTPKTIAMLLGGAILQPILFRVGSQSWEGGRHAGQLQAQLATAVLIAGNSVVCLLILLAVGLFPQLHAPYGEAMQIAVVLGSVFSGFSWSSLLGASIVTNAGLIRLPIYAHLSSIAIRCALYAYLIANQTTSVLLVVLISESASFICTAIFWRPIIARKLWSPSPAGLSRWVLRGALGALACYLAIVGWGTTLWVAAAAALHSLLILEALVSAHGNRIALRGNLQPIVPHSGAAE